MLPSEVSRAYRPSARFLPAKTRLVLVALTVLSLGIPSVLGPTLIVDMGHRPPNLRTADLTRPQVTEKGFTRNAGQLANPEIRFYADLGLAWVVFTPSDITLGVRVASSADDPHGRQDLDAPIQSRRWAPLLRMLFEGAGSVNPTGWHELRVRQHFFLGRDPISWRSDVESYARVVYRELYPGISAEFYLVGGELEYDLVLQPGADLQQVRVRFEGASALRPDGDGATILATPHGDVIHTVGASWQGSVPVDCEDVFVGENVLSFQCVGQNAAEPLMVDPVIHVATVGGWTEDIVNAGVVGADGSVYLTGYTDSFDFPVSPGALNATNEPSGSAFVMKLDPTGRALEFVAILGGDLSDKGTSIALDEQGNVVIGGRTQSDDFPLTAPALDSTRNGSEGFLAKLGSGGSQLLFSTFLGGEEWDEVAAVTVDEVGEIYVTGFTESTDFPPSPTFRRGWRQYGDVFVVKISADGSAMRYGVVLSGGYGSERPRAIAVDGVGSGYVVEMTESLEFPTTRGTLSTELRGITDAFITKISPSGTSLEYSTLLGGKSTEEATSLYVDHTGRAYVTGFTYSEDFPMVSTSNRTAWGKTFVALLSADGTLLESARLLGGTSTDHGAAIAVDASGRLTVGGKTNSADFPEATYLVSSASPRSPWNCFATTLMASTLETLEAHVLGGSDEEECVDVGTDASGDVYLVGNTRSTDFARNVSLPWFRNTAFWEVFVVRLRPPAPENPVQDGTSLVGYATLGVIVMAASVAAFAWLRRRRRNRNEVVDKEVTGPSGTFSMVSPMS